MNSNDLENIKNTIASNGYKLENIRCSLDNTYNGYEKSNCFNLDKTTIRVEFHHFEKGGDAINAVSSNTTPTKNFYFRQIAVGKIWLILRGEWSNKSEVDILMDKVVEKI